MPTVLILGATSDVAQACARRFAKSKNGLILAGRNLDLLSRLASDLSIRYQVSARAVPFDATAFESHDHFYAGLNERPDVTICAFGLLGDQLQSQTDWNACRRVIDANYTGAVSILNIVANDYESRRQGVIVGISSIAGERGRQSNYIYGSAKAGFTSYLSGLRNRLHASNVHVVTVKPGFIASRMTEGLKLPKPITATPDQVAIAIDKAMRRKTNVVYSLWMWRYIRLIIRNIPEGMFKKLKL